MTPSIPASELVQVVPSVLGAGGNPLSLNAMFLTHDDSVPNGEVLAFATSEDVGDYFGNASPEAIFAAIYFAGFEGASTLPGALYFYRYNEAVSAGWLRGASLEGMTVTELSALAGIITIVIDGRTVVTPSVNLSSATSFSSAAALIQTGLQTAGDIFTGTAAQTALSTTMTVTAVSTGALHVGDVIVGTGVTLGTTIVSQDSGTPGGAGDYTVDNDDGFASTTIRVTSDATCAYDSQLNAFVITSGSTGADSAVLAASASALTTGLKLTAATGAVVSPGADASVPADTMAAIVAQTQNWASFFTTWEPVLAVKEAFADWVTVSNDRYVYVAWDSDVAALVANASGTFGDLTADFDGVCAVWNPDGKIAAFLCGAIASLNFSETNGRATFAYRRQSGLTPDITDATEAANLTGNHYNFYGSYSTANQAFQFLQTGQVSGSWLWLDEYVNQIYLNAQLQLALLTLLTNVKSVPYNAAGYNLIRAAALDPINEALNFGTIRAGVTLSASQVAQVNTAAGVRISDVLQTSGYYLQILDASAIVRAARGSPPITLWYMSGGSIQRLNLASIDVL